MDLGLQNSRGFRALKVWLGLQQVERASYVRMISEDIRLAQELLRSLADHADLEALTQSLSIATFRYVPADLHSSRKTEPVEAYLNQLNREVLTRLEKGGEAFLSNAVIDGKFVLRMCIVNLPYLVGGYRSSTGNRLAARERSGPCSPARRAAPEANLGMPKV